MVLHGLSVGTFAQGEVSADFDRNIGKLNLTALPLGSIDLQYERVVARKMSAALGLRMVPGGGLPFASVYTTGDEQDALAQIDRLEFGNFAITPEFRFYLGKHDGPRGFYIAPFARYSVINAEIPDYAISSTEETINLDGKISGISGGLMLGSQWRLGSRIYLDWWILGAGYGSSSGELNGVGTLSSTEQQDLRDDFSDLDIAVVSTETTVDANGIRVGFDGPWATLRGGLLLGIKF
ncbi:DUF3575 domain-containing protein [Cyclobacterium plantarum]|uniref:DUF3575 domain-containing protein n=1 Tax=Cyclobacterium plantarum TaxID=2716263 RepID=A0ABX0HAS9_9BACT|nr:DUF3575 domain-containing protein [Cyclobacterium plantarum]NHE58994.1 DUF3575 domain-containing protein [Cyclobacterium plantarum]